MIVDFTFRNPSPFPAFHISLRFLAFSPRGVKARRGNGSMKQTPSQREIKVNLVSWIRF